ncbi:MAG TPA: neuraminidase-like domain-containing protein [Solirubrobacteraceae bacterium]|jgi:hypothetical protein|nr:neuraminidase-like domain-containing protein [Solirubrobacteraceae bacterium]
MSSETNITPGLVMGTSGAEVAALHDALTVIGLQIDVSERDTQSFGATTAAAVIKLQVLAGIEQTGVADENTVALIVLALDRLGIKPGDAGFAAASAPYSVGGTVTDDTGLPLADAEVVVYDCDLRASTEIGRGRTDSGGAYVIAYDAAQLPPERTAADLRVAVKDDVGKTLLSSPLLFNASRQAEIDLALGGPAHAEPSEFASIASAVTPLLGSLTPAELQESSEHQDLGFIAGQTGIPTTQLGFWVLAARLVSTTELPAELFYGLFRSGVPADANVTVLASSTQGVDLQANAEHLLEGVLSASPVTLSAALDGAIEANLIPATYAAAAPADLQKLATLANRAALDSTQGLGKTSFASVLDAVSVPAEVQQRFIALYLGASAGEGGSFWSELKREDSFNEAQVADLQFGVSVGRMTRGYLPLIEELATQRRAGQIEGAQDLARLSAAQWGALLEKQQADGSAIGVPSFIDVQPAELARESYATMLERTFTLAYPTTAFSARLVADQQTPFSVPTATAQFLDANPTFDLRYTNIDEFATKMQIPAEVRATLLTAQRLIKVNPNYSVISALLHDDIQTAQQIYAMGRDRFVGTYASLPALGATEAARTWAHAEQTYGMALMLSTQFNARLDAAGAVAVGKILPKDTATKIAAFPNLQTLFESESLCECEECESVLGDAAYLADILDFLDKRQATGKATVRDVLLQRRPDIAQIELNCENTDTALPYIDLVNELLEEALAPPQAPETPATSARKRQTTLSTPELNANPEHVNDAAYEKLTGAVYPWTLPFDLPLAEARAYLGQLNLSRAQLIAAFQPPAGYPSPQAETLAREQLGLSQMQADIITAEGSAATIKPWEYWGLGESANAVVDPTNPSDPPVSGSWVAVLTQVRILLARSGLQFHELQRLLNTEFVNGEGKLEIVAEPPGSCDVAKMQLVGLDEDALQRIHRFVRLWRCLGWNPYDLDNAIASLQSTSAPGLARCNALLLRQLACVGAAMSAYSLSAPSAVALLAPGPDAVTIATREIPTLPGDEQEYSLYHELFENLTVLNPPDPIFALDAQGSEVAAAAAKLAEHGPALVGALQISEADLARAIAAFTDGALTLANLSTLYRNVELASALGVTISELIALLAIVEQPSSTAAGYETVAPFDASRPEGLARFAAIYATTTASGLSVEQIDYLVRDVQSGSTLAPEPVALGTLLLGLYNGLVKIASENAPAPDPTGARTGKALATVLSPTNVQTAIAILAGTSKLDQAEQESFITAELGAYLNPANARERLTGASALAAGAPRYEYALDELLADQTSTLSQGLIVQTLAQALGLESATAELLLSKWFPSTVTPGAYAIADFLALPGKSVASTTEPISPQSPGFVSYFTTYAALAKAAMLIATLKLGVEDVKWWKDSGVAAGWLDPTALPGSPQNTAEGRFYRLARLIAGAKLRGEVPVPNASFATLLSTAGASKSEYLTRLATQTQWQPAMLAALCGDPTSTAATGELALSYPHDYESETALARIVPCEAILARTGIPAELADWIAPAPSSATADEIRQSVKANYPDEQWLTLAKQLRDPLRESQRDALVSYLLAQAPPAEVSAWLRPDDVFAYFLIDVEMCSCMATSRLVQATATVQMFVQRCFLGLEAQATVDAGVDSGWTQWQWMGQYRVWQANREVFLFPENWIDPSLRADASPFFGELQQELKQASLSAEAVEAALQGYLEKLEAVARLDVCGYFHDSENGEDVLHVLARTQGSPPAYYMRKLLASSLWTAWEKVELDINSDHVLPLVWSGRQYIFWALVAVKADEHGQDVPPAQSSATPAPPPSVHLEVQLAWSQYKQGKWQPKQTAPKTLVFAAPTDAVTESNKPYPGFQSSDITLKSSFNGQLLEIDVFLDEVAPAATVRVEKVKNKTKQIKGQHVHTSPRTHVGAFLLGGAGSGVEAFVAKEYLSLLENVGGGTPVEEVGELNHEVLKPAIDTPAGTTFDGDWLRNPKMHFLSGTRPRIGPMNASYVLYDKLPSELVLERADYYRLITPHQSPTFDSRLPFFHRDSAREYFVAATNYYENEGSFSTARPEDVYEPFYRAEYRFWPFYHPFARLFVARLNIDGLQGLYAQELQLEPAKVAEVEFDFATYYKPTAVVLEPYPQEAVDFEPEDGYALYNWELFFHVPFLVANALSTNQEFELAKQWYEYVFKPTGVGAGGVPQRYWVTRPFHEMTATNYAEEQIAALMEAINKHNATLEKQVEQWRAEPFDPDMIAQMRPVAYQRAIVMHYIDNLIAWGDQLFGQDTMESINLATQLYVLAEELLGPRPEVVPPLVKPKQKTYSELESSLDAFSNALVAAENAIPPVNAGAPTPSGVPSMPTLRTFYFQIPPNSQLLGYWDTVADRLYKIRHCMNIEGVVQQLSLFSPPINPALLVAATAAGVDLSSLLSETNAALPPYRFRTIIRHALELCEQVRALGAELLTALERKDAEALALIRSAGEVSLQTAIEEVRARQIAAAKQQIAVVEKSKQSFADRERFYLNRPLMNDFEAAALILRGESIVPQVAAGVLDATAAGAHLVPEIDGGVAGAGGSPNVTAGYGGENLGNAASAGAAVARMLAGVLQTGAEMSATLGQYSQRHDDWGLQATVAKDEIARLEAEKLAGEIHLDIAEKEKAAQAIAVKTARAQDSFMREKFTNEELYEWTIGQTSTTYFQAYQLAYAIAKAAERCFERELAIEESDYIQFGYWESLHHGLTAGEKLHYDLRRLQSAYLTQNERELEIVKHVSLLQLDPYALVELRATGSCQIDLPEILFDLDNPGHYMRRLKTVGVTVPCVVGPYTSVSATLTLLDNQIRTSPALGGSGAAAYTRKGASDERFLDDSGATEIVTSSAQADSGLFELRFEDERYLPFEVAGAVSNWRFTLNNVYPQFDYNTITDVVLHLRYTARDGGAPLREAATSAAKANLNKLALAEEGRTGLYRLFSARHEYPTNWAQFLDPAPEAEQILALATAPERFPFFSNGLDLKVRSLDVFLRAAGTGPYTLMLSTPTGQTQTVTLEPDSTLDGIHHQQILLSPAVDLGRAPLASTATAPTWTLKLKQEGAADYKSLPSSAVQDLLLLVAYQASE